MAKRPVSSILYVDLEEFFPAALAALGQWDGFGEKVELIVVDPHLSEAVKAACGGCPNVRYLPAEGVEIAEAYNLGLGEARGEYIGFSLASGTCSPRFFRSAMGLLKDETVQMVSANPVFVDVDGTETPYAGAALPEDRHTVIDLTLSDNSLQLLLQAYLFRRSLLEGRSFDASLHEDALLKFLLEIQLDCPVYTLMKGSVQYRYTVSMEDNTSTNPLQYHPWWYGDSVNRFLIPLLDGAKERFGRIPDFLQAACYYQIYHKFNCNLNDRNKGVLPDKAAVTAFAQDAFQALTRLDNRIIARQQITTQCKANRGLRML
ncbi:MAG: glycosyltransferase, partial [Oscillospiraceae bacterium]|nr:glycosyltransferase [Oscillospiraceae bacterium]